jgi:AraC-like DNA-binding protein
MPNTSTPAQYALILIDLAQSKGCDRNRLLAGTSLADTDISSIGARVRESDFNRLVNNALALTGHPGLGLELGLRLNLSAHAVLGQAFMACHDLNQAMELFLTYYHLLAPGLHLEVKQVDRRWVLSIDSHSEHTPDEFRYELLFGALLNTLRGLLNNPALELRFDIPYPEPAHSQLYRDVMGEDIRFDCVRARVSAPLEVLSTPLPSSNPVLRSLYEAECARLMADLAGEDSVAEQTLRLLRKLEGQYPQMPQIARMLNFSPRTYRRKLERENFRFQELLDKVRAEHATRYLQNTGLPLTSIAYMVGFNDASNFRRAYLKWTGHSPREVRNGRSED